MDKELFENVHILEPFGDITIYFILVKRTLLNKSFAKLLVRKLVILGLNDACLEGYSNGNRWKLIILICLVTWERGGHCAPQYSQIIRKLVKWQLYCKRDGVSVFCDPTKGVSAHHCFEPLSKSCIKLSLLTYFKSYRSHHITKISLEF